MRKYLFLLLGFVIVTLSCWFVWVIFTDKPPEFFPLSDPEGRYTVLKSPTGNSSCQDKKDIIENGDKEKSWYIVRYQGEHVFSGVGETNCFDIYVGKSKQSLDDFLGKEVKITGKFVDSSKQCIETKCEIREGRFVVLDIESINLANK